MSVIVLINIIVPVYASAADVADNNSCVTGEGLEIPKAFEICSQRTDKAENEYIVSLNVTNDWGNGFTGEIKIQNLSAEPIDDWRLNFDTNFTIEDIMKCETGIGRCKFIFYCKRRYNNPDSSQ